MSDPLDLARLRAEAERAVAEGAAGYRIPAPQVLALLDRLEAVEHDLAVNNEDIGLVRETFGREFALAYVDDAARKVMVELAAVRERVGRAEAALAEAEEWLDTFAHEDFRGPEPASVSLSRIALARIAALKGGEG